MCRYQKIFVILQRVYRVSKPWQKVRLKYSFVEKIASFQTDRGNMIPVLFACNVLQMHSYRHKTLALFRSYQGFWRYHQQGETTTDGLCLIFITLLKK